MDTAATQTVGQTPACEPEKIENAAQPHIAVQVMEGITFAVILIIFGTLYATVAAQALGV